MTDSNSIENLNFDFAPAWARKSADEYISRYQDKNYDERTGREDRFHHEEGDRRPARKFNSEDRMRRPSRRDTDRPRREEGDRSRPSFRSQPVGDRKAEGFAPEQGRRPLAQARREWVKPLEAEVRILPNQQNLGIIIKKLQSSHIAFPIKKFVNMFLDNPQACLVRIEVKPETEQRLWFCKQCNQVATSESEITQHVLETHLGDIFTVSEEPCEPPTGSFTCVAKSSRTNEWIGAPSHHSYKQRLAAAAARAGMREADFQQTLEMYRDPESIEAWKQSVTTQTVYRLKSATVATPATTEATETETPAAEDVATYNHDQAEFLFRRDYLPKMIEEAKHVCLPLSEAQRSPAASIRLLIRQTLLAEQRLPRSLFYALHGAFRHRKFTIFRANVMKGPEFVTSVKPVPFNTDHVVKELADAIHFVTEHPTCTRTEMIAAVAKENTAMAADKLAAQIGFLLQRGHIIEYYNGVLALPEATPKFRKLPEEMPAHARQERSQAQTTAVATETTTPVAETVVSTEPTVASAEPAPVASEPVVTAAEETPIATPAAE